MEYKSSFKTEIASIEGIGFDLELNLKGSECLAQVNKWAPFGQFSTSVNCPSDNSFRHHEWLGLSGITSMTCVFLFLRNACSATSTNLSDQLKGGFSSRS